MKVVVKEKEDSKVMNVCMYQSTYNSKQVTKLGQRPGNKMSTASSAVAGPASYHPKGKRRSAVQSWSTTIKVKYFKIEQFSVTFSFKLNNILS